MTWMIWAAWYMGYVPAVHLSGSTEGGVVIFLNLYHSSQPVEHTHLMVSEEWTQCDGFGTISPGIGQM